MFEIGNSLREARLRQRLDFPDMEQTTKVRAKYLRALEDEHFDTLPSATYVKGFLRTYAEALGLDGQLYVDEYNSRYVVGEEEQPIRPRRTEIRPRGHRRAERNVVLLVLVAIVLATVLVFAAWRSGSSNDAAKLPTLAPAPAAKHVATPKWVKLLLRAPKANSWVEVRRGSASGRVLYRGTLEKGQAQRFVGPRFWLNVGAPRRVSVTVDGKAFRLPGVNRPQVFNVGPAGVERLPAGV